MYHISCAFGHYYLMTHRGGSVSEIWNNTKCLAKTSSVDEKCSLNFYNSVHQGSLGPILAYEKRDEMEPCISYGDIFRVGKDGAC